MRWKVWRLWAFTLNNFFVIRYFWNLYYPLLQILSILGRFRRFEFKKFLRRPTGDRHLTMNC